MAACVSTAASHRGALSTQWSGYVARYKTTLLLLLLLRAKFKSEVKVIFIFIK